MLQENIFLTHINTKSNHNVYASSSLSNDTKSNHNLYVSSSLYTWGLYK